MTEDVIAHHGWQFRIAMAGRQTSRFHAFYLGSDFGHPRRGALAVVAYGLSDPEAASLAVHGLAEGYFYARETLSPLRAAARALSAINQWLYDQGRQSGCSMAVSLVALSFAAGRAGVIQVGNCRAVRRRGTTVTPLSIEHALPGASLPSRAVGADSELLLDTSDDGAAVGDRYVLLTPGARLAALDDGPDALVAQMESAGSSAIVIDILAMPAPERDEIAAAFADLPLRPPPHEGDLWDGFHIGRRLFTSRYTVLHLAADTIEHREVVLKIPLPGIVSDPVFRAGFLRESWIGTRIESPWVARYLALAPGRQTALYLAMPYYEGQTLEQRLATPPPVDLIGGLGIAVKLCRAVADLERLQIIHRDIKPENILLLPDGGVRLLDLGIAFLPGVDLPDQAALGGTTRYMAPELFKGGTPDPRSEVYALAMTFYRMWTGGKFPFGQREAIPLARLRPDLPPWLGSCLAQALDWDPQKRFANSESFVQALDSGLVFGDWDRPPTRHRWNDLRYWKAASLALALVSIGLLMDILAGKFHWF